MSEIDAVDYDAAIAASTSSPGKYAHGYGIFGAE
jgi:hypothetical protein